MDDAAKGARGRPEEFDDSNHETSMQRIEIWKAELEKGNQCKKDRTIAMYLATKYLPAEEQKKLWKQFEADENRSQRRKYV